MSRANDSFPTDAMLGPQDLAYYLCPAAWGRRDEATFDAVERHLREHPELVRLLNRGMFDAGDVLSDVNGKRRPSRVPFAVWLPRSTRGEELLGVALQQGLSGEEFVRRWNEDDFDPRNGVNLGRGDGSVETASGLRSLQSEIARSAPQSAVAGHGTQSSPAAAVSGPSRPMGGVQTNPQNPTGPVAKSTAAQPQSGKGEQQQPKASNSHGKQTVAQLMKLSMTPSTVVPGAKTWAEQMRKESVPLMQEPEEKKKTSFAEGRANFDAKMADRAAAKPVSAAVQARQQAREGQEARGPERMTVASPLSLADLNKILKAEFLEGAKSLKLCPKKDIPRHVSGHDSCNLGTHRTDAFLVALQLFLANERKGLNKDDPAVSNYKGPSAQLCETWIRRGAGHCECKRNTGPCHSRGQLYTLVDAAWNAAHPNDKYFYRSFAMNMINFIPSLKLEIDAEGRDRQEKLGNPPSGMPSSSKTTVGAAKSEESAPGPAQQSTEASTSKSAEASKEQPVSQQKAPVASDTTAPQSGASSKAKEQGKGSSGQSPGQTSKAPPVGKAPNRF